MAIFEYGEQELDYLRHRDQALGDAMDRIGMIRREVTPDLFTALTHSVVSQQISSKAAQTVWQRFRERFPALTPGAVAASDPVALKSCGMSARKAGYIIGISEAIVGRRLDIAALPSLSDGNIIKELSALPGIGVWTAEMVLIFSLQRRDVVSWGDLAIRRGMMNLYGLQTLGKTEFESYRQRYSPYGSVASLYLWALAAEG